MTNSQTPSPACFSGETLMKLAQKFPFRLYAQELARLANVVEDHSKSGEVSLQMLSQLVAMEEIVGLIRTTGLAVLVTSQVFNHDNHPPLESQFGYI